MSVLYIILAAIIVLGPLVAIHEFGHFYVARRMGVKVLTYSIGFGPVLWKRTDKQGTQFQIALIPLGGFVRMADEREGEVPEADLAKAFNRQSTWARMAIVAAGPVINLLFAIFLYWILFLQDGEMLKPVVGTVVPNSSAAKAGLLVGDYISAIDNKPITDWEAVNYALIARMGESGSLMMTVKSGQETKQLQLTMSHYLGGEKIDPFKELGFTPWQPKFLPIIGEVLTDGPAATQGLKSGDKVVAVDAKPIATWQEFVDIVRPSTDKTLQVDVQRGSQLVKLSLTPKGEKDTQGQVQGKLGIALAVQKMDIPAEYRQKVSYGPVQAFTKACEKTGKLIQFTIESIVKMLQGLISPQHLSGPITIAKVAGHSAEMGWQSLVAFMALLSVSLGVLNLLPIPVLDGGHLVYLTAETILGRPVPEKVQEWGLRIGFVIMVALMLFAIFNDISRL
jgi:regulator of sigma E protease